MIILIKPIVPKRPPNPTKTFKEMLYKKPAKAPPRTIIGILPTVVLIIPTNDPAKITSGKCGILRKFPSNAPSKPTREEATTADKPYFCNKKVIIAALVLASIKIDICCIYLNPKICDNKKTSIKSQESIYK